MDAVDVLLGGLVLVMTLCDALLQCDVISRFVLRWCKRKFMFMGWIRIGMMNRKLV